jgi:hypothetical protein
MAVPPSIGVPVVAVHHGYAQHHQYHQLYQQQLEAQAHLQAQAQAQAQEQYQRQYHQQQQHLGVPAPAVPAPPAESHVDDLVAAHGLPIYAPGSSDVGSAATRDMAAASVEEEDFV